MTRTEFFKAIQSIGQWWIYIVGVPAGVVGAILLIPLAIFCIPAAILVAPGYLIWRFGYRKLEPQK